MEKEPGQDVREMYERMREFAKQFDIVILLPKAPPVHRHRYAPENDIVIIDYITAL